MKTINNSTAAVVSGGQESARLTIEANGKAFKELISGIYSDKPYAISRELIANAMDSHTAAGCPERAFEMHLPTVFEPVFSIRDFGTSMTHEQVMTLYRTLFRSSKDDPNSDDSNKFVGKFGLGSKSPFAYTDAFQLTAFLDGRKRVYDIYFNAGAPMITLFLDVEMTEDADETIEENGILITFPVNPKDCDAFAVATQRAIEPLKVDPIFTGRQVSKPQRTVIFEGAGWQLLDSTASGSPEALQGTVLYPLHASAIPDLPEELYSLFRAPFRVDFEIGQLDIITSREALSFDEQTTQNIIDRFKTIRDELQKKFTDKLATCQTYYEFCCAFQSAKRDVPNAIWEVMNDPKNRPLFRNKWPASHQLGGKIKSKPLWVASPEDPSKTIMVPANRYAPKVEICIISTISSYGTHSIYQNLYSDFSNAFKAWDRKSDLVVRVDSESASPLKTIVVLHDTTQRIIHADRRIKALVKRLREERGNYRIVWVKCDPKRDMTGLRRIYARFGRHPVAEILNLADMPFVKPEANTKRHAFKVMYYDEWRAPAMLDERSFAKKKQNIYYVHLLRERAVDMGNRGPTAMNKLWKAMADLNIVSDADSVLIGVPPKSAKNRGDIDPSWIDFRATVEQVALSLFDPMVDVWNKVHNYVCYKSERSPFIYDSLAKRTGMLYPYRIGNEHKTQEALGLDGLHLGVAREFLRRMKTTDVNEKTMDVYREFVHPNPSDRQAYTAQIDAIARKLIHQANVWGGRACEEFPELIAYALDSPSNSLDTIFARRFKHKLRTIQRDASLLDPKKVVDELVKLCQ